MRSPGFRTGSPSSVRAPGVWLRSRPRLVRTCCLVGGPPRPLRSCRAPISAPTAVELLTGLLFPPPAGLSAELTCSGSCYRRVPGPARAHRPRALDRPRRRHGARHRGGAPERDPPRAPGDRGRAHRSRGRLPRLLGPGAGLALPGGEGPPPADAQAPRRRGPRPGGATARAGAGPDRGAGRRRQVDHAPRGELPRLAASLRGPCSASAVRARWSGPCCSPSRAAPAPLRRLRRARDRGRLGAEATALPYGPWLASPRWNRPPGRGWPESLPLAAEWRWSPGSPRSRHEGSGRGDRVLLAVLATGITWLSFSR